MMLQASASSSGCGAINIKRDAEFNAGTITVAACPLKAREQREFAGVGREITDARNGTA
jgi:hypothetical protein